MNSSFPKKYRLFALIGLLVFGFVTEAGAEPKEPTLLVEGFQSDLIAIMKQAEAGATVEQRYNNLLPTIAKVFHIPLMTRIVTGPFWDKATPDERRRLIDEFRKLNVTTLAFMLDGYSGETFQTLKQEPGPQGTQLVKTRITTGSGKSHDLSYVVHRFNGRPWIIDVIVDAGISELTTRRSEYNTLLKSGGFEGLITALTDKIKMLKAAKPS